MTIDLNAPLALPCGVQLPNRLLKSAMTEGLADRHDRATGRHATLYRRWSTGGTGTLITGNVMIDRRFLERPGNVVIEDREGLEHLKRWAAAGTAAGNQLWMQISHPGRQCAKRSARRPMAPSAVQLKLLGNFGRPVAMSEEDIQDALDRFARTAGIAREAGFTGVQLHAAHGYLISQFLSPRLNRRTDGWGGALAARARFLLEAVARTRRVVGPDFPVAVKLNSADFQKGGFRFDDSIQVAQWLEDGGVDLIEISGGNYEQPSMFDIQGRAQDADGSPRESTRRREAFFLEYAARLRREVKLPLAVTGGFRTRRVMLAALNRHALDVVGMARPLVTEPDLSQHLLDATRDSAVAHEHRLKIGRGPFGPHSRLFLFKALNALGPLAWYYRQIIHLAHKRRPQLRLGVLSALILHQVTEIRLARRRQHLRSPAGKTIVQRASAGSTKRP
jgi:2,4-dienoyl-CoA reductase-like NADH-dependent reductase (Old Yellow Enzyme family)